MDKQINVSDEKANIMFVFIYVAHDVSRVTQTRCRRNDRKKEGKTENSAILLKAWSARFFSQFFGWIFFRFFLSDPQKKRWREKRKEMENEISERFKTLKRK